MGYKEYFNTCFKIGQLNPVQTAMDLQIETDKQYKEIQDLKDKLHRRNMQIKDLKVEKDRLYKRGIYQGLLVSKKEIQTSIDRLSAVEQIEIRMNELNR